jgi:hypothetical protein
MSSLSPTVIVSSTVRCHSNFDMTGLLCSALRAARSPQAVCSVADGSHVSGERRSTEHLAEGGYITALVARSQALRENDVAAAMELRA